MSTCIADLAYGLHVALEGNYLTNAKLMSYVDFVVRLFQLLVKFHHGSKCHEFESLPGWRKTVVWIFLVVAMDDRITFEIRGVYLLFKVACVRTIDNRRANKPYRIGIIFVGEMVNERCTKSYLDAIEITHKQEAQVKIKVIEIDRIFKQSSINVFMCTVTKVGIRFFKWK